MNNTAEYTGALILWKQGTPRTQLGDAAQSITLNAKRGCATLSETGFDGLIKLLLTRVGPNKSMMLEKSLAPYNTATCYFIPEMLCNVVRLGRLDR